MKSSVILGLRWIGAIILPLPGAWLVSMLIRCSSYLVGFGGSFIDTIFESFGTGAAVPLIAYYVAPQKRAVTALVISSLLIAFIVFCMGVYWRNITTLAFIDQCVIFTGMIVGVVSAFQMENHSEES